MSGKRENWSGQLGFVLAAAASAVGLGNLWRFPASAAQGGGGIFLLVYLLLFFGFGAFLLVTEITIGRATKLSPIEAYRKLASKWVFIGWLGTIVPFLIMPYYAVVGGWVVKYLAQYLFTGTVPEGMFGAFTADVTQGVSFMLVFTLATFVFIFLGVREGIERSNKVMMPALLAITVAIAIYVVCQPGMGEGIKYYLLPDFSRLAGADGAFSPMAAGKMVLSAMGQMFFSVSIAMGIMITYGSYVPEDTNLPKSAFRIGLCDTIVAFIAGVIVIPPAFKYGGAELAQSGGVELMFTSLPRVFATMPCARLVAIAFFTLVLFAALTSAISMTETCVASLCDRTGWSRRKGGVVTMVYSLLGAVPSAYSLGFLGKVDYFANNILMPICALSTCVFIGWIIGPDFIRYEATKGGRDRFPAYGYYRVLIRYIAPIVILLVFLSAL